MEECTFQTKFKEQSYNVHYIKTIESAFTALKYLDKLDCLLGIDTETCPYPIYRNYPKAGLSPHLSNVRLLQVFDAKENAFVFDALHIQARVSENSVIGDSEVSGHADVGILFRDFLNRHRFIAHNALFDLQYFKKWGAHNMNIGCTYIAAKLIIHAVKAEDTGLSASLKDMVREALKVDVGKQMQLSDWSISDLTKEQIEYAGLDPILCLELARELAPRIQRLKMDRIYNLCKNAQHPIAEMQINGIMLDIEGHRELITQYRTDLYEAKKKALSFTGLEDITPMKLGEWLEEALPFDILQAWPRTETGKISTDAHTFADWSHLEMLAPIGEYQKLFKITSSFGNNLLRTVNPQTQRIHSNYKICGARTGRLSCNAPNIQQIPKSKDIRSKFTAPEGKVFVCADFSQIELRIAAEVSQEPEMLRAYREGIDLHRLTASRLLNKPMAEVSDKERQIGKALGLGLLYGLGAKKFAHYVKKGYNQSISNADAKRAVESFRETYPVFRQWQIDQAEESQNTLMAKTILGKRRKLNTENAYGGGLNMPIQGAAAEVMLCSLVNVHRELKHFLMCDVQLVCCVHDEIILEVDDSEIGVEVAKGILTDCMREGFLEIFPNGITRGLIEAKHGKTWMDAK